MLFKNKAKVCALWLFLLFSVVYVQGNILPIKHNPVNNSITAITQDNYGFMWIGTMRGVMRYDGYTYKTFRNNDTYPLAKDVIRCLFKDRKGNIWIGTNGSGAKYDYATNCFVAFDPKLDNMSVNTICESTTGLIVMGTERGVALVNPDDMSLEFLTQGDHPYLSTDKIVASSVDNTGNVWMASNNGFYRLMFPDAGERPMITSWMEKRQLTAFAIDQFNQLWYCNGETLCKAPIPQGSSMLKEQIIDNRIEAKCILLGDKDIWIGTSYRGVHKLRIDSRGNILAKEEMLVNKAYENNLCNYVYTISRDKQGRIWLGTIDGLFLVHDAVPDLFRSISEEGHGLSHNVVSSVYEGMGKDIWAGTSGGLDHIEFSDAGDPKITHYMDNSDVQHEILNNRIQSILIDNDGIMWLGSRRGISFFDLSARKFFRRASADEYLNAHDASFVKTLYKDSGGNVWIGFLYGGLMVYDQQKGCFHKIRLNGKNIDLSNIHTVLHDKQGNLWFGTKKDGLFKISAKDLNLEGENEFVNYQKEPVTGQLPSNWITTLYCDRRNNILVGTSEGLCLYDRDKNRFVRIPLNQTGENEYICSITEDMNGVFWIFTTHGVYRYLLGGDKSLFYEINNGVFARIDYQAACCLNREGRIFSSGIKGITYFNPEQIIPDTVSLPIYFTNFSILNKEVVPGGGQLSADINESPRITLTHSDYQFSFEFSALSYADPNGVRYAYWLEGFEPDWVYIDGSRNYISYSNLPAGDYQLHIKCTNASGMWTNESRLLAIEVLPPWWATWWSFLIYTGIISSLAWLVYRIVSVRLKYRRNEQENQWKQRFYMNVTHGFKTPLTLLQVPLEALRENSTPLSRQDTVHLYAIMDKNVKRLSNMIYQLLEFNKIDRKKATLKLVETDVVKFMQEICLSFKDLFDSKGIALSFQSNISSVQLTFDPEKIETTLFNMLLNACYFTGKNHPGGGGEVAVHCHIDVQEHKFWVNIKDNGIGIRPEHQRKIFERFWQVRDDNNLTPHGAGIGLSLSKEYVEMHKGKIFVESEYGKGATFSFYLLLGDGHFDTPYYIDTDTLPELSVRASEVIEAEKAVTYPVAHPVTDPQALLIYILSDDQDMPALLSYVLRNYRIRIFNDPAQVHAALIQELPALVVVDVVARSHDQGIELCSKIRKEPASSHIPIVLLTAEESKEDILLFYNIGIDVFFEKPFDVSLFQARVKSLLQSRKTLKEKLKMDMLVNPKKEEVESADDKFMSKVMEVIEQNIPNEEFTLVDFARQMNMSRSVLHTRIQALVNQSPIELLRTVRMKKAAQLLLTEAYNITQISYMVGFSDSRYFSTSFKKQYGMTPREYIRNGKETGA